MFYDEDNTLNPPAERVQFGVLQNSRQPSSFNTKVTHFCEIVMIYNDPIQLGKPGLTDAMLISDQEGLIRAWI